MNAALLFNYPTITEIYTLSLHDALPIFVRHDDDRACELVERTLEHLGRGDVEVVRGRSEEHTSELQSPYDLVCRLLLEKKKAYMLSVSGAVMFSASA